MTSAISCSAGAHCNLRATTLRGNRPPCAWSPALPLPWIESLTKQINAWPHRKCISHYRCCCAVPLQGDGRLAEAMSLVVRMACEPVRRDSGVVAQRKCMFSPASFCTPCSSFGLLQDRGIGVQHENGLIGSPLHPLSDCGFSGVQGTPNEALGILLCGSARGRRFKSSLPTNSFQWQDQVLRDVLIEYTRSGYHIPGAFREYES